MKKVEGGIIRYLPIVGLFIAVSAFTEEGSTSKSSAHKFGPSVSIGFPHPISINGDYVTPDNQFSLGAAYGFLPTQTIKVGADKTPVSISMWSADLRGRWHPWKGSFFVGALFGRQSITGSTTQNLDVSSLGIPGVTTAPVTIEANLASFYATPHLGWMWIFNSGIFMGLDAGVQFGFGSETTIETSSSDPLVGVALELVKLLPKYQSMKARTEDGLNKLGNSSLPYITLFKIGYLF